MSVGHEGEGASRPPSPSRAGAVAETTEETIRRLIRETVGDMLKSTPGPTPEAGPSDRPATAGEYLHCDAISQYV